ncbi:hypothetical protein [Streptomyces sp. NBC_00236]|uniref:hypothetical protein n=1 Tax=Streptomyces sp. NBC_00236 TaxID=2903639 RepID=UPI002E2B9F53|nr:hypothetical protein [Streptomyces sp. NBC_00236]
MAEREERPRIPAEEPATAEPAASVPAASVPATSAPAASAEAADPTGSSSGKLPPGDSAPDAAPPSVGDPVDDADTLSGLLAALGRHLESHAPDEVVVLLREEMERRELRAYSNGWRDAAAQYEPALQEARAAGGRTLRLVSRATGQAAVIPLRRQPGGAADRAREDDAAGERTGPAADGERGTRPAASAPALVPKSRSSRVPTIPRLRPPSRRPSGDANRVTPDGEPL